MDEFTLLIQLLIVGLIMAWIGLVYMSWHNWRVSANRDCISIGLALWPAVLVDPIVRVAGVEIWYAVAGVFHFATVLVAVFLLRQLNRAMQPATAIPAWQSGLLIGSALLAQLPSLFFPVNQGNWINAAPSGDIQAFWWVYTTYLINACSVLVCAVQMLDISRRYERCLPWQAVDVQRYRRQSFGILSLVLVVVSFVCFVVVLAQALGVLAIEHWPLFFDLSIAICMLALIGRLDMSSHLLPSPLRYDAIGAQSKVDIALAQDICAKADKVMIARKGYKEIGLTIREFTAMSGQDPTSLFVALHRVRKQDFRGFVFHYRMEYAKNVVMRTDTSIAEVAKRLGFHTERFLSGPFLQHLEKRR